VGFWVNDGIQETKKKAYIGDHGCWMYCRGYIITGRHGPNALAGYKFMVTIGEELEGDRHEFGYVKALPTDVH
jgi:hypothetical protein